MTHLVPLEKIEKGILLFRGHRVMLDRDLAALYGVPTKVLNQAVRRNGDRFPIDFMFELSWEETKALYSRSQIVTLNKGNNIKYLPIVFTEHGIAMLSSVLRSPQAVQVNIEIMRAFVRLREILSTHKNLAKKVEDLEEKYDARFKAVFDAIRELMAPEPVSEKRQIGFHQ